MMVVVNDKGLLENDVFWGVSISATLLLTDHPQRIVVGKERVENYFCFTAGDLNWILVGLMLY